MSAHNIVIVSRDSIRDDLAFCDDCGLLRKTVLTMHGGYGAKPPCEPTFTIQLCSDLIAAEECKLVSRTIKTDIAANESVIMGNGSVAGLPGLRELGAIDRVVKFRNRAELGDDFNSKASQYLNDGLMFEYVDPTMAYYFVVTLAGLKFFGLIYRQVSS